MDEIVITPNIMLSYGNDDYEIAEGIYNYLDGCKVNDILDKYKIDFDKISFTSIDFMGSIINSVEKADVTIILISPTSIESPWVQFELNIALNQSLLSKQDSMHNSDSSKVVTGEFSRYLAQSIRIIPVLIAPVEILPPQFWIFNYLECIDYTAANDGTDTLRIISERIDELTGSSDRSDHLSIDVRKRFNLETNYNRLYHQVGGVLREIVSEQTKEFDEKLTSINRAFEASSSLLSPAHITIKETTATEAIWVVSRDMYNDLRLKDFQESIRQNYIRGLEYVYFIEDVKRFDHLEKLYNELFDRLRDKSDPKKEGKKFPKSPRFKFIPLSPGTVMPFDEVVIYDPEAGRGTSAYVQLSFDQHPSPQTVYIDLPKSTSADMVRKLTEIKEAHEKRALLAEKRIKKKEK